MTKVYGSTKPLLFVFSICVALLFSFYNLIKSNGFLSFLNSDGGEIGICVLLLGYTAMRRFICFWAYDENGFETRTFSGKTLKRYKWEQVSSINWRRGVRTSLWNQWAEFETGGVNGIGIGKFSTHNYLAVLSDVVRVARNKKIYLDPEVLKQIEKS